MIQLLDRIGRPLFIRILLPCALVWFCWELVKRLLMLIDRAIETGQPIPDVTAGLVPLIAVLAPIFGNIVVDQVTRHRERRDQIARGEAPSPFGGGRSAPSLPPSGAPAPSSPSPTGGLVNSNAIEDPPQ